MICSATFKMLKKATIKSDYLVPLRITSLSYFLSNTPIHTFRCLLARNPLLLALVLLLSTSLLPSLSSKAQFICRLIGSWKEAEEEEEEEESTFTYMGELGCYFEVYRNDELTVEELKKKNPRGVLISSGPGAPKHSGISLQTVLELGPIMPLFGVAMGLRCIGEAFGGRIVRSLYGVMHGKSSLVYYDEKGEDGLFSGLSNPFTAGRYHSLVIEKDSFPHEELEITAWTEDGSVMAARHKKYKYLQGVQFQPESIITNEGKEIVRNFIRLVEQREAESQS